MATIAIAMFGNPAETHVPLARRAERLGFSGIWLGEHLVALDRYDSVDPHRPNSPPVVSDETELYDIWTLCGALLAATEHMYVAPGVYIAPLRHPLVTSLAAITAVKIGGGSRFMLGVGAGWMPEEFTALDQEFSSRFGRLREILEIVRATSQGGSSAHSGKYYEHDSLRITHEAVTLPIIMGGVAESALRRTARYADGWYNPGLADLDECVRLRGRIEQLRAEYGASGPFDYYIRTKATMDSVNIDAYREAGFENLVVPWESMWTSRERRELALEQKYERLAAAAERMGLTPRQAD